MLPGAVEGDLASRGFQRHGRQGWCRHAPLLPVYAAPYRHDLDRGQLSFALFVGQPDEPDPMRWDCYQVHQRRSRDASDSYYRTDRTGWEQEFVEDYEAFTAPFLDLATAAPEAFFAAIRAGAVSSTFAREPAHPVRRYLDAWDFAVAWDLRDAAEQAKADAIGCMGDRRAWLVVRDWVELGGAGWELPPEPGPSWRERMFRRRG